MRFRLRGASATAVAFRRPSASSLARTLQYLSVLRPSPEQRPASPLLRAPEHRPCPAGCVNPRTAVPPCPGPVPAPGACRGERPLPQLTRTALRGFAPTALGRRSPGPHGPKHQVAVRGAPRWGRKGPALLGFAAQSRGLRPFRQHGPLPGLAVARRGAEPRRAKAAPRRRLAPRVWGLNPTFM